MRSCGLLLALLLSITAKAVTLDQSCHDSVVGPATTISCTLTNPEPKRAYIITAHWYNPTLSSEGPLWAYPACLTPRNMSSQTINTGHDDWYLTIMRVNGTNCTNCNGPRDFTITDIGHYDGGGNWISVPVTNIQLTVTQTNGLKYSPVPGDPYGFGSFMFGTGGSPSGHLDGSVAGEFAVAWVSTSRGPMDTFTAGAGWTLDFASAPDTVEWQITDGTDPLPITFGGATTAYWNIMGWYQPTAADGASYCSAPLIAHRRVEF